MNINKLLKRNLSLPLEQRLAVETVVARLSVAASRGNAAMLLAQIHREIEPELEKRRKAQAIMDRIGSRASGNDRLSTGQIQGYVADLKKYSGHEYGFGRETEPDLANENEPRFGIISESVKIAESSREEKFEEEFGQ